MIICVQCDDTMRGRSRYQAMFRGHAEFYLRPMSRLTCAYYPNQLMFICSFFFTLLLVYFIHIFLCRFSKCEKIQTATYLWTLFMDSHVSIYHLLMAYTVYPKKYAHGFVVLCFVVVMQSFIMNSHEVFIHIHQGCFAGTGAIVRLPQCQWSKPGRYGKISQCITTTKHSKAKTVCIFLGIYCTCSHTSLLYSRITISLCWCFFW